MRVVDKVVLVTGGLGNIGAACGAILAREGATVILADLDSGQGKPANFLSLDITKSTDWQRVIAEVVARHGRIDAMVHSAGIEGAQERGLDTSEENWRRVIDVNLTGSFLACKAIFPQMMAQGKGSVVLLSSAASDMATAGAVAYGASKAGVSHLARTFAAIGAQNGARVRCNAVLPGSIESRMSDSMFAAIAEAAGVPASVILDRMKQAVPFGERGTPEDIASLVLYLASDESSYATGCQFKVDGGWSMKIVG